MDDYNDELKRREKVLATNTASLMAHMANLKKKKHQRPYTAADFLNDHEKKRDMSDDEIFAAICAVFGPPPKSI